MVEVKIDMVQEEFAFGKYGVQEEFGTIEMTHFHISQMGFLGRAPVYPYLYARLPLLL